MSPMPETTLDQVVAYAAEGAGACPPPPPAGVALVMGLGDEIIRRRAEKLGAKIKPKPRTAIWPSSFEDCDRRMVYEFTHWQDKKLHDWHLEALFGAGNVNEAAFKSQIRELGFDVVEDGSPLGSDMASRYNIVGYLDWRIKWSGRRVVCEAKMMSPMVFDRIRHGPDGIEDMKRFAWTRKYIRQLTIYLLGTCEDAGLFALTNGRGEWKFVPLALDYSLAESLLKQAERVRSAVAGQSLPDRVAYDPEVCGRCPFAHICIPDIKNDERYLAFENAVLEDLLDVRAALAPKAAEFKKVDEKVKATLEAMGVAEGVSTVGGWVITIKKGQRTVYNVPDAVKQQYSAKVDQLRRDYQRFQQPDTERIYSEPRRMVSLDEGDAE